MFLNGRATKAVDGVVVHHPCRLHERVADRRADEAEATPLQILRQRTRLRRLRGDLRERAPLVDDRLAADERPEVRVERAVLLLYLEHALRVRHRRLDLEPVADDACVAQELLWVEPGDARGDEARERGAIAVALVQDRRPGEPGLRALEH